ncbi:hypothetical protein M419DRAFT_38441 [Trichoderma reesei RUT C-30]|uniref:Uncharacterized protein n=1 Tax=Hypocrea jecorina (strain ATCC 56765 / BCRC 32924 / NRRL 11460 / Rut C-30) TaxID=1344414 RepID=A0A024S2L0_HYPJR|nr:hypothetical protein M419DRAFT_38441 [Trichoderma reesei RUT C-30]
MASLLVGNITSQCVEVLAGRLLRGLTSFDEQESRRAIVFVAYDFGDLIVKKVFTGCFQRTSSTQPLDGQLFPYLWSQKPSSPWYSFLSTLALGSLSRLVVDMTEAFVASRITLRAHVISLYTGATEQGRIHKAFDYTTALIGLPDEVIIQEQTHKGREAFPGLSAAVCFSIEGNHSHKEPAKLDLCVDTSH